MGYKKLYRSVLNVHGLQKLYRSVVNVHGLQKLCRSVLNVHGLSISPPLPSHPHLPTHLQLSSFTLDLHPCSSAGLTMCPTCWMTSGTCTAQQVVMGMELPSSSLIMRSKMRDSWNTSTTCCLQAWSVVIHLTLSSSFFLLFSSHFFKYVFVTKIYTWGTQGHAALVHSTFPKSYKHQMNEHAGQRETSIS